MDDFQIVIMSAIVCSSLLATAIALAARHSASSAVDLARGTSKRSQDVGHMLGELNSMMETLDRDLCKEIDQVKARVSRVEGKAND